VGGWRGGFFSKLYLVWKVDCPVFTWTLDFPCKFYWGEGGEGFVFLSANGKAQGALLLFLLNLGAKSVFFSFSPVSQCVLTVFPPKFLMGSQYVPQHVLHLSTALLFHMLWQMLFFFHLIAGLKGGTIYIKTEPSILRSLHSFIFWGAIGQSNWLVAPPTQPPPQKNLEGTLCLY
jgi:hypothetical protein